MSSAIVIAGTTFDGLPNGPAHPYKPNKVTFGVRMIGRSLPGKDGTQRWLHRAFKHVFTITWEKASVGTLNATRTIRLLTASFTYTNEFGASFTVINSGEDDYVEEFAFTSGGGVDYYNLALTLREV